MYIRTIDIAHPPLASHDAEETLNNEITLIRYSNKYRVLKVIHGYGSRGRHGVLKDIVQNWSYNNRARILGIIPGEEYDILDAKTIEMRKVCGQTHDPDLGACNPGITLIWIK